MFHLIIIQMKNKQGNLYNKINFYLMLTVFGSTAYDTIRTPSKTLKNVLGGAATYAAISSSNFVKTGLIAVVGDDFQKRIIIFYQNI